MKIEIKYDRKNVFDVMVTTTDSITVKKLESAEKAVDAAFGKFAVDQKSMVSVCGLQFTWNDEQDFNSDIVSFSIKGNVVHMKRVKAVEYCKKYIEGYLKENGYMESYK